MTDHERPANGELGPQAAEAGLTMESLQADVARLSQEVEYNWQQFLRAAADLENYRKQAARQREDAVAATRRSMLMIILSVVDTLERAIEHASGASAAEGGAAATAIADGLRLAHRHVVDRLATMGARPMETIGQPFDPRVHEAVEAVPATGIITAGTVVGEVQRGYLLGDEVLRPARVRVAQ